MRYVKTKLRLVGSKDSITTQDPEALFDRFEMMQDERLQSPIKLPAIFNEEALHSIHRLFVRIYSVSSEKDLPAL
ncbi:MAG TPA: hypothetical protein VGG26_07665 [Terracidiphilus sp.]|jgi:hypothetical protein